MTGWALVETLNVLSTAELIYSKLLWESLRAVELATMVDYRPAQRRTKLPPQSS